MAIDYSSSADQLVRTTDLLDYNAAYTWMTWVLFGDTGSYRAAMVLFRDTGKYDGVWKANTNVWYLEQNGGIGDVNGTGGAVSGSTWYHIAMVRSGVGPGGTLTLYVDGSQEIQLTGLDVSLRQAMVSMQLGQWTGTSDGIIGRLAYTKAWSAALPVAEIRSEMDLIRPVRFDNLYESWPTYAGAAERYRGYMRGRDWTPSGTPTDVDPPPVAGGTSPFFISFAAAAPTGAIMNQLQGANLGADLFNGALL